MSRPYLIAQISDIHFGSGRFDPKLAEACLARLAEEKPDVALVAGDLTDMGYAEEFDDAARFLDALPCPFYAVPGNHDERNVGWRTYERLFGSRWSRSEIDLGGAHGPRGSERLVLAGCDSAEPDLDEGELGRVRHRWIAESFTGTDDALRMVMLHHHLVAVPNTGRERNTVSDAGDVLDLLAHTGVDLVLAGHRHVPYVWIVDGVPLVMSGTATTWRVRGEIPPSFNLIRLDSESIAVKSVETLTGTTTEVRVPYNPRTPRSA